MQGLCLKTTGTGGGWQTYLLPVTQNSSPQESKEAQADEDILDGFQNGRYQHQVPVECAQHRAVDVPSL